MFIKSLTMKGFKSFADPTTLELEPGVTVVVGPNGSGKSNVVDAVAWVLGAQGPSVVRGAKMDDVIFAGSAKRPPLGRAEVSLVIDNSRRLLPIEFTEVTITRTLFRTGESEYALNGVPCRLLDVQELLSDTGVGRSQHVIVGQGQLDSILSARPEERRMVIEEAAGVLKYRRRKERASRRLETSEASLLRLQDLLREVRRQLRPLERQAASANIHALLQSELRAIRLYLAGRELAELDAERLGAERSGAEARRALEELAQAIERADAEVAAAADSLGHEGPEELTPLLSLVERLGERARGLLALVDERRRAAAAILAALEDQSGLAALHDDLARIIGELDECESEAAALAPEWERLAAQEAALIEAEVSHAERFGELSAVDGARLSELRRDAEGAARGLAAAERAAALANEQRRGALAAVEALDASLAEAGARRSSHERELASRDVGSAEARRVEQAGATALALAEARLRTAEEARHRASARAEALRSALEQARARADLERLDGTPGLLGSLRELLDLEPEVALALEAALPEGLDAALLSGREGLDVALSRFSAAGGAIVVVPDEPPNIEVREPPAGCRWLRDLIASPDVRVARLLNAELVGVAFSSGDLVRALALVEADPGLVMVTGRGDRVSAGRIRLAVGSLAVSAPALAAADASHAEAAVAESEVRAELARARRAAETARAAAAAASGALERARAGHDAAGAEVERASAERSRLLAAAQRAAEAAERAEAALVPNETHVAEVAGRLAAAEANEAERAERRVEADAARRALDARARALSGLRRDLEVRAAALEERRSLLTSRRRELEAGLAERAEAIEQATVRRAEHEAIDATMAGLAAELRRLEADLAARAALLSAERDRRLDEGRGELERLSAVRAERDRRQKEESRVREGLQRIEISLAELRVRREAAVDALHRELDAEAAEALATERPELADGLEPATRARRIERELHDLGPVNPLAAEELAVLSERSSFLESQLEDVRRARRELSEVIRAVDSEIVDVFAAAYHDVAENFESLIATLFAGGQGSLHLTSPEDLLETGVEIEVRPPGRNVRRLSLLSGGERSLVALAYLFAVFRARPSPFYLLDEVEAALDEVNLTRFHGLVDNFRAEAQLIIVSHQKKTMEVADALYGISMQPGEASKVVSERVPRARPPEPSFAAGPSLELT